jgi:hypothetical protein
VGIRDQPLYDLCVANKIIDGKQCTIAWHVDDLKISHVDPNAVTSIIGLLDDTYGQEIVEGKRAAVTFTRGKLHDYLGMLLDYSEPSMVKIAIKAYVSKILDEMPEDMDENTTSPDDAYLFTIKEGIEDLSKEQKKCFHATVEKLLFLCKCGRSDIQTAMVFLHM